MSMEHVIACVAEQILHALLALDDRSNGAAQLTFQANLGRSPLHDVFGDLRRGVAIALAREVNHFVVRVRVIFF